MPLLQSLMRRLGYAKLDQFGLELANDYIVSHNRKAMAVSGDWVVGWRESAALVAASDLCFDEPTSVPKLALGVARAQTQPQIFGTPLLPRMASNRPETDQGDIVQAEAVIVMQSEVAPSDPSPAGDTLMMAPTTAQRDAATPQAAVTTAFAAVHAETQQPAANDADEEADADEEEWAWIMARAKAEAAAAEAAACEADVSADDEAREWEQRMSHARQAAPAAAPLAPATADIDIPIIVVTPQFAFAAVQAPEAVAVMPATAPVARAAAGTIPTPYAAPVIPSMPAPLAAPLPRLATATSTASRAILPPSQLGAPPHLSNGSVTPPIGLQSHTARIFVGAIPAMPGSDATRRTRPTTKLAIRPGAEPDNDPVIAPPRPGTISPASRLARPLPPLPMRTLPRPAVNAQAPLRPVPRVTRLMPAANRPTTQIAAASAGAPANASTRRLATAS